MSDTTDTNTTDDAKMNDTPAATEQKAIPPPPIKSPTLAPPSSFKHPTMSSRRAVPPRTADSPISPIEVTTPEVDQSFMRWSTTSEAFSEAELSTWSYNPHSAVPNTAASRGSSGTYAIGPDSATSKTAELGTTPEGRSSFDTFGAGARQRSNQDVSGGSMGSGRSTSGKSRPMSMSSVSGSLYHGALAELGKFDTGLKDKDEETPKRIRQAKVQEPPTSDRQPMSQHLGRGTTSAQEDHEGHHDQVAFSLTPPPRGHRSAASVPLAGLPAIRESNPAVHRMAVYSPRHRTRSKSIDTISVEHSLSDSVTGLLRPANQNIGRIPLIHPSTFPAELVSKNDLNPDQRAVLLRRAKKLEQLLGQSLDERSIERLLIDPIHQVRTVTTQAENEVWPSTPLGGRKDREWQRDDCVPRKGKQVDTSMGMGTSASMPGLARSGSVLAKRARAALGLDGKYKSAPRGDLAVYVSREMRVSETAVRGVKPVRDSISSPPATVVQHDIKRNMPISPKSILDDMDEDIDEDEVLRRKRRLQLAKVILDSEKCLKWGSELIKSVTPIIRCSCSAQPCHAPKSKSGHRFIRFQPSRRLVHEL